MSALHITLTNAGYAALVNAQNTGTNAVLVNRIGVTEQAFNSSDAAAAAMTALPGELKQLSTFAGDAVADDTIHVTIRDDGSDSYTLRGFGLYLADGTLLALYGQTDPILEKSTQAMLLLAADIRFTGVDTAVLEFGDTNWINPPATDQTPGVVQLATPAQAVAGTDPTRALTPATHKAAIDARFGTDSPSTFIKGLLNLATAALFRSALGIKGAALKDDGAGNGLNADLLDGQHGAHYRDYRNLTQVPSSFPPSPHGHNWIDIDFKPATATRWPTFAEVSDKPTSFPPSAHTHSAGDIRTGTFDPDRIPTLQTSKVSGLDQALAAKANSAGLTSASGYFSVHSYSEAVYGVGLMRSFYDANNARWNLAAISTPGNSVPLTVTINGHEVYHKGNIVGVDFSHTTPMRTFAGMAGRTESRLRDLVRRRSLPQVRWFGLKPMADAWTSIQMASVLPERLPLPAAMTSDHPGN